MYVDLTRGRPLTCSKCGSTNAVKPVNDRSIAVKCGNCGHTKLTREAEQRRIEIEHPELLRAWQAKDTKDRENTF